MLSLNTRTPSQGGVGVGVGVLVCVVSKRDFFTFPNGRSWGMHGKKKGQPFFELTPGDIDIPLISPPDLHVSLSTEDAQLVGRAHVLCQEGLRRCDRDQREEQEFLFHIAICSMLLVLKNYSHLCPVTVFCCLSVSKKTKNKLEKKTIVTYFDSSSFI